MEGAEGVEQVRSYPQIWAVCPILANRYLAWEVRRFLKVYVKTSGLPSYGESDRYQDDLKPEMWIS